MEDPDWTLWRSFLAVLQTGSLSQAARHLRLTQPTLGRHISLLERALGAVLFTRSNDGLRPTEAALALREQAETMAAAADLLTRIASGEVESMAGRIRLTTSEFMGVAVLPPILAAFRTLYPKIDIDLVMSDRNLDLLRGDADLAVRNVAPVQEALVVRKIGEAPVRLFAHRSYVALHGLPQTLAGLEGHGLIGREEYRVRVPVLAALSLRFGFTSPSDIALLAALRAGLGIGACQQGVAAADPSLLPVLPEVTIATVPVWIATHEDRRSLRRVRLLFDHLAAGLSAYLASAR
ncbi:MAG TPA: LysR family transcriptional regulator [Acidisoma sp.]|uniref:LysR family transcriptional regulator n=1 Tax=Acidisoma sp. TaxID=1872115 RepID=UPI002CDFCFEA|nr:LysR family transcriptional regulator [Acidisoma sp.]HTI03505.1 LysR family transcriptional regulator [Acidisoma sp.]